MDIPKLKIVIKRSDTKRDQTKLLFHNPEEVLVLIAANKQWNKYRQAKTCQDVDVTMNEVSEAMMLKLHFKKKEIISIRIVLDTVNYELKSTIVKISSTIVHDLVIESPNLQVERNKSSRADCLTLISSTNDLGLLSYKFDCNKLTLQTTDGSVRMLETLINCKKLEICANVVFLNGHIYGPELELDIRAKQLHISVDGSIGRNITGDISEHVFGNITGSVSNFGEITANSLIDLNIGAIKSLLHNENDTAHRGYNAVKGLFNIRSNAIEELTSEALGKSINAKNVGQVASLLENGVDPKEEIEVENGDKRQISSPLRLARKPLQELDDNSYQTEALMKTHHWQRGKITASSIKLVVENDLEDIAQIYGKEVEIHAGGFARCEKSSIWSSESVKLLKVAKNLEISGQVKILNGNFCVTGDVNLYEKTEFGVEDFLDVKAYKFFCYGFMQVGQRLTIVVDEDFKTGSNAVLVANDFKGYIGNSTVTMGMWIFDKMDLFSNKKFYIAPSAKIEAREGDVLTGNFLNAGTWKIDENLKITANHFMQHKIASISVKETLTLKINFSKDNEWCGLIKSNQLMILAIGNVFFSGEIDAIKASIALLALDKSYFSINGAMYVHESPIYLEYSDKESLREERTEKRFGLMINGVLYAQAIYGKEVDIKCSKTSQVFLTNVVSTNQESAIMIHCWNLHTFPNAKIFLTTPNDAQQQLVCKKMIHEGRIVQSSTSICSFADELINNGYWNFGSQEVFYPYLNDANFIIKEKMLNKSEITAKILRITGQGDLVNQSNFSTTRLDIKMNHIDNKNGRALATDALICYTTSSEAILEGCVEVKNSLLVSANSAKKLEFSCRYKDLQEFYLPEKCFQLSAKDVEIYSNIKVNSNGNEMTKILTKEALKIYGNVEFDLLIISLEEFPSLENEFLFEIKENGVLVGKNLRLKGVTKFAIIVISGSSQIKNFFIEKEIHRVSIQGQGLEQCIHHLFTENVPLEFQSLSNLKLDYLEAKDVVFKNGSVVNLQLVEEDLKKAVQFVIADSLDFQLDGTLNSGSNILFTSKEAKTCNIKISGTINSSNENVACRVECQDLEISGQIQKLQSLETDTTSKTITQTGKIDSIKQLKLQSEWLTHNGTIENCAEIDLFAWGMICNGAIQNYQNMNKIVASLVFVNTGSISGQTSTYAAPFMFNSRVKDREEPKLEASENGLISLKSLVCLNTESQMIGQNIQNQAVLLFKLATVTATELSHQPNNQQLEHWRNITNSLHEKFSSNDPSLEQITSILEMTDNTMSSDPNTREIGLRAQAGFYIEVRAMVENMSSNGIEKFCVTDLVDALLRAQEHFRSVNLWKERLLAVPKIARDLYKKGIRKVNIFTTFGFNNVPEIDPTKSGIQEVGLCSSQMGYIDAGNSDYCAHFLESYTNDGTITSAAGDIIIESANVYQSSRGRMLSTFGKIFIKGEDVAVNNIAEAKQLIIEARDQLKAINISAKMAKLMVKNGSLTAEKVKTEQLYAESGGKLAIKQVKANEALIKGKDVSAVGVSAKKLLLEAQNNLSATNISSTTAQLVAKEGNLNASNVSAEHLFAEAGKDLSLDQVNSTETFAKGQNVNLSSINSEKLVAEAKSNLNATNISSGVAKLVAKEGAVTATGVKSRHLIAEANQNVNLGDVKATTVSATSHTANVNMTDKIEADTLKASAANTVNLVPTNSGQANHKFGTLSIDCKKMQNGMVKELLEGSGVFRSMEVRDMLDLAVTDEKIVLDSISRTCSLSLKFKEIDIVGKVSTTKSFRAEAEGNINIATKQQEPKTIWEALFHSRSCSPHQNAGISAGGDISLESKTGSITLKQATIEGNAIDMTAAQNLNVLAEKSENTRAKASYIKARKGKEYGNEGRTKGLHMKAGGQIDVYASNLESEGDMILQGKQGITTRAATTTYQETSSSSGFLGFNKKSKTTIWAEVDKSNLSSGGKIIMQSEQGGITSVATDIHAQDSVYLDAENDIKLLDLVTQKKTKTSSSSWWGLSQSSSFRSEEMSEATRLVTKGDDPNIIKSRKGNIFIEGSTIDSQGKTFVLAEEGDVSFKERILNTEEYTESFGFNLTSLSFKHEDTRKKSQTIAGSVIKAQALEVKAKKFIVEGLNIETGQLIIDAEDVNFIGNKLESSMESNSITIGLVPTELKINIETDSRASRTTEYSNQLTNIGGPIIFKNVKNCKLENANIGCDEIIGSVDNMEITSKASTSTSTRTKVSLDIGFVLIGGVPTPIPGLEVDKESSDTAAVKQISGVHSRKAVTTKNLKMKYLKLIGGLVSSNNEIEEFAENIEAHDVEEHEKIDNRSIGLKIMPGKTGVSSVSFGDMSTKGTRNAKIQSSMISGTGKVASGYQVNTKKETIRQITNENIKTSGFKFHAGKDGIKAQVNEVGGGIIYSKDRGVEVSVKAKEFEMEVGVDKKSGGKARVKTAKTEHGFEISTKENKASLKIKQEGNEFSLDTGKGGAEIKIGDGETSFQLKAKEDGAQIDVKNKDQAFSFGAGKDKAVINFNDGDNTINVGTDLKNNKTNADVKIDGQSISATVSKDGLQANVSDGKNSVGFNTDFNKKMDFDLNLNDGKNSLNLTTKFEKGSNNFGVKFGDDKNKLAFSTDFEEKKEFGVELGDGNNKLAFSTDFDTKKELDINLGDGKNKLEFSTDFNKKNDLGIELSDGKSKLGFSTDFDKKTDLDLKLSDGTNKLAFSTDFDKKKELGIELGVDQSKLAFATNFDKKQELDIKLEDGKNKLEFSTDFDKKKNLDIELGDDRRKLAFTTDFDTKKDLKINIVEEKSKIEFSTNFEGNKKLTAEFGDEKAKLIVATDFDEKDELDLKLTDGKNKLTFSTDFDKKKVLSFELGDEKNTLIFGSDFDKTNNLDLKLGDNTNKLDFSTDFDKKNDLGVRLGDDKNKLNFATDFEKKKDLDFELVDDKNKLGFSTDFDKKNEMEIKIGDDKNKLVFSSDFDKKHDFDIEICDAQNKVEFSTNFENTNNLKINLQDEENKIAFSSNFEETNNLDINLGADTYQVGFSADFEEKTKLDIDLEGAKNKLNFSTNLKDTQNLDMTLEEDQSRMKFSTDFENKNNLEVNLNDEDNKFSYKTDFKDTEEMEINLEKEVQIDKETIKIAFSTALTSNPSANVE